MWNVEERRESKQTKTNQQGYEMVAKNEEKPKFKVRGRRWGGGWGVIWRGMKHQASDAHHVVRKNREKENSPNQSDRKQTWGENN